MVVEALTFKVALDLLEYFRKGRLYSANIVIGFWDRVSTEFITFNSLDEMSSYFESNYQIIDTSSLGSLCYLQSVNLSSDLYDFPTQYSLKDVTSAFSLTVGSSYDIQRNAQRSIFVDRQSGFIRQAINEYLPFYNDIRTIYVTGIYSQLYAVPGWSRGTWYLNSLQRALLSEYSNNSFPYPNVTISKDPPA